MGDSWTVIHYLYGRFNDFETIQTVPADLGVSYAIVGSDVTVTITSLPAAAVAPSGLTATALSHSAISLAWTAAGEQYGFLVERSEDGGVFEEVVQLEGDATSYQDTGLLEATPYTYRVSALGVGGNGAVEASATTQTAPELPVAGLTGLAGLAVALAAFGLAKRKR